jgi:MoaA/NifB/PqqE/SkfB family radical SAM enzyme
VSDRGPIARELPRELYIEVTNRCNSRCETCIRTFELLEPLRDMRLRELRGIVDQFAVLERVVLHGIGEPLLNAELTAMIRYVKMQHPKAKVLFNSNTILLDEDWGQELVESGLDEFRVSLDAATAGTYSRIRGVDAFDLVVQNLRLYVPLAREAQRPRISFWLTVTRENLPEIPALVDLAADLGVPEVYAQRLVLFDQGLARADHSAYRGLRAIEEAALDDAAQRARSRGLAFRASGLVSPQESLRGPNDDSRPWSACFRPWVTTYITANGNVLPCCISPFSTTDYQGLILGNAFRTSFAEIWNGSKYVERRRALHTEEPLHPCERCGVCWSL